MTELDQAFADNRKHVDAFIAALEPARAAWSVPVRTGKWSPAQVAEHIVLSYREAGLLARGDPSGFPRAPRLVQPIIRIFFRRILTKGTFPKSKTFGNLTPLEGAASVEAAATRIRDALAECETCFRSLRGPLQHPAFGAVPPADYVKFLGFHTRHHQGQLRA